MIPSESARGQGVPGSRRPGAAPPKRYDRGPLTDGDSSRGRLIAASLLLAAIVVGLSKLPYGMFWPDEGFYLSSSYRLLLGDRPFRDELSYSSSWFFLVLTPILSLLPDGGTVLQVRFAGFIIRAGAAAVLFLTFHRWLPGSLVVSGLAVSVLANYPSLMVPNYNSLPFDLGFVSLACWLAGVRSTSPNAVAWGSAAGVLFALSCLCYLPRLPLLLVPMVIAGLAVRARHHTLARSSVALVGFALLVYALAATWLFAAGLWTDLRQGVLFQAQSPLFKPSIAGRLSTVMYAELKRAVPSVSMHLAFWAAALVIARRGAGREASARDWIGLALLVAAYGGVLAGIYLSHGDRSVPAYGFVYSGLCWLPLLSYPVLRRLVSAHGPSCALAAGIVFSIGLGQPAVAAFTSTQVAVAGIPGVAASLLLLLLSCDSPSSAATGGTNLRLMRFAACGFCLCLAVTAALFHFYAEQNPLRVSTVAFEKGRMQGVRSSRRFVDGWSRIVDYLRPRLHRAEFLLAYENVPLLYYLTDTRPALRASYVTGFMYGPRQQQTLVDAMVMRGRVPRYAVRLMAGRADEYVEPAYSRVPETWRRSFRCCSPCWPSPGPSSHCAGELARGRGWIGCIPRTATCPRRRVWRRWC